MLNLFKKKEPEFFTPQEKELVVAAIKNAELRTSGEVRVFIENKCKFVDALDRAIEIFSGLKMYETADRNAVLVYIALKDHQLAIFGDEGIHQKVGTDFWNKEVQQMLGQFNRNNHAEGLAQVINEIGEVLVHYFPYNKDTDKNELSDDIVFGR